MNTPENQEKTGTQLAVGDIAARGHRRSLRSKLVLSLAAMFLVILVVDEIVRQRVITPSFVRLEQTGAVRDANRVLAAIDVEGEYLAEIGQQLAARINPARMSITAASQANLPNAQNPWKSERIAWLAIVGTDGSWRWLHQGPAIDKIKTAGFELPVVDKLARQSNESFRGMTRVSKDLFLFAGTRVESSSTDSGHANSSHFLVVGRSVDAEMVNAICKRTQVDFSLQAARSNGASKSFDIWEAGRSILVVEAPLLGLDAEPLANVFVQIPRDITMRSKTTTTLARNTFVFGATAALLLVLLLLQRIVVGPIEAIREHTEQIAEHGLSTSRLVLPKNDEIGELAVAFDRMTMRLSETHQKLADASHAAGMSQVADTVIHNVGNVLTNVNSLLETATERVSSLRIQPLEKLAQRLQDPTAGQEIRSAAPDYMQRLAQALETDRSDLSELLSTLNDNVQHIHDVIRDQRRHTLTTVNKTQFSLYGILAEAITCCRARLDKDQIVVTMPQTDDIEIEADRSLLSQIVINVIGNARQAIRANRDAPPRLEISLESDEHSVSIRFCDSGCGMTPETLSRVFEAHFTTRNSGSGLGLHFCAIAMERMGGSIQASSDGAGKGSTFVIQLPRLEPTNNTPLSMHDDLTLMQLPAGART